LTVLCKFSRSLALAAALAALAGGLEGCGRRGPLDLPEETQARGQLQKAEAARAPAAGKAANDADKKPEAIPGTIGRRPPDQYPFPLDPLL